MSSIQIKNVTKKFDEFTALHDLSIDIQDGEFVALLGPSGCGKTTTMNMIAGLEEVTSGEILFNGQDLSHRPIQQRNIGFVFQNYAIFTHMSVYKNLSYSLEVNKLPKDQIISRVQAMAKRMNLLHCLDAPAAKLSVNEMQKLAIGRSAIAEPRIFLLDEPLSNLDAGFRAYMRSELKVLQREFGQTMIYVTHDQIEAMSLADKIAIINRGRLMQYGSPLEVYNNPCSRFVANFVGSPKINLLDGHIEGANGTAKLVTNGGAEVALQGKIGTDFAALKSTRNGSVGIRPQDIYFGDRRASEDIPLHGHVEELERVGPKRLVHLLVHRTQIVAEDERDALSIGDEVNFHLTANKCMAFDFESGDRVIGGSS